MPLVWYGERRTRVWARYYHCPEYCTWKYTRSTEIWLRRHPDYCALAGSRLDAVGTQCRQNVIVTLAHCVCELMGIGKGTESSFRRWMWRLPLRNNNQGEHVAAHPHHCILLDSTIWSRGHWQRTMCNRAKNGRTPDCRAGVSRQMCANCTYQPKDTKLKVSIVAGYVTNILRSALELVIAPRYCNVSYRRGIRARHIELSSKRCHTLCGPSSSSVACCSRCRDCSSNVSSCSSAPILNLDCCIQLFLTWSLTLSLRDGYSQQTLYRAKLEEVMKRTEMIAKKIEK